MVNKVVLGITLLFSHLDTAEGIGRSIEDCRAIASQFDNTCSSTESPIRFADHIGQSVSCSGTMRCPGGEEMLEYTEQ